ncbi:CsgE family curli-type amyloid fiber assembly protein [Massilia sp. Leaf139]|uniref:CsgE family curli-type amyloid fiber assembly protein n=1 Tax=Massilia sp. Leaf139 TaxID=1736272 RepID=UPI0006F4751A|nr:CsgE family curli-type amyloid fiber assembly protein [Massilia sp. Leaf139]KQQ87022.1 hypothetical protein ASF77_15495 [Massilia sp. Leaf139]
MRAFCWFVTSFILFAGSAPSAHESQDVNASGNASTAASAVNNASKPVSARDLFDGIVIDQTITRAGKDFYQLFSASWFDQPLAERYTVSVRELPSARFGSQIIVTFGNRRIYQGQISPNRNQNKRVSETAVEIAYKAVTEGEMQRLLFKDPDLGQDEI